MLVRGKNPNPGRYWPRGPAPHEKKHHQSSRKIQRLGLFFFDSTEQQVMDLDPQNAKCPQGIDSGSSNDEKDVVDQLPCHLPGYPRPPACGSAMAAISCGLDRDKPDAIWQAAHRILVRPSPHRLSP